MRPIKFRAWDRKTNAMREDIQAFYGSFWDILKDENWVVMQFTGLRDKNGNEIYEGDILRHKFEYDRDYSLYTVVYHDAQFRADAVIGQSHFTMYENTTFEIIGNVFENPELITKWN